ncbi:MAG: hypothetical protein DRP01_02830 [Archaeoglobales archaeon]|nr:MAG: hypothetical protein DRP01_02830 [Archaeoglobales archaeon]
MRDIIHITIRVPYWIFKLKVEKIMKEVKEKEGGDLGVYSLEQENIISEGGVKNGNSKKFTLQTISCHSRLIFS